MTDPRDQAKTGKEPTRFRCPDPACGAMIPRNKWLTHLNHHPKHHNQLCPTCQVHHLSNETCPQADLPKIEFSSLEPSDK